MSEYTNQQKTTIGNNEEKAFFSKLKTGKVSGLFAEEPRKEFYQIAPATPTDKRMVVFPDCTIRLKSMPNVRVILEYTTSCRGDRIASKQNQARVAKKVIKSAGGEYIYVLVVPDDKFYPAYRAEREIKNNNLYLRQINNQRGFPEIEFALKQSQVEDFIQYVNDSSSTYKRLYNLKKNIWNHYSLIN